MATIEQNAQQLIKKVLSLDAPSYEELIRKRFTGFMDFYLQLSRNDQIMSTTADMNVTIELASIDQLRDHNNYLLRHAI